MLRSDGLASDHPRRRVVAPAVGQALGSAGAFRLKRRRAIKRKPDQHLHTSRVSSRNSRARSAAAARQEGYSIDARSPAGTACRFYANGITRFAMPFGEKQSWGAG